MDKILEKFFELERWEYAIDKGLEKGISKAQLYQLTKPETRVAMYEAIRDGEYEIAPPHAAQIPKDNGEFRTVYINEPADRVLLSIANDLLFELMPEMVHPQCRSYQKGIGCGTIVQEVSKKIRETKGEVIGWKADFSKYFDNDPIFAAIMGRGTVPNRRLFRRWVMAQVFHMLNYKSYSGSKTGFVAALEAKGYKYQWKMVLEEMRVQAKLATDDPENFILRNRWFNDGRIMQMGVDYLEQLVAHINKLKVRHCKGVPYVKLGGRNVFTADVQTKVIDPIVKAMAKIGEADTPQKLYYAVNAAVRLIQQWWFTNDACMSQAFKDAYKGAGAYFTMQNLILFHGASFKNGCIKLGQKKSLAMLENKAHEYATSQEGWRLFGVMKKLIADSGINIGKKMEEWRK